VNSLELAHLWSGVPFVSCLCATLQPSSSFGYFVLARKQSKGKPGRKYQGEVIKLKGFSTSA
jgi:hypothetical protein